MTLRVTKQTTGGTHANRNVVKYGDTILISFVNSDVIAMAHRCGNGRIPMRPYTRNGEHIRTAAGLLRMRGGTGMPVPYNAGW